MPNMLPEFSAIEITNKNSNTIVKNIYYNLYIEYPHETNNDVIQSN